MRNCPDTYYITVIVDKKLDKIIGSGTIVHEKKFIHECGSVRKFTPAMVPFKRIERLKPVSARHH